MNYILFYIGVLIAASAQMLLKLSVERSKAKRKNGYFFLFCGYVLMFLVTLLNLHLFKYLPAKIMITAPAGIYVFVGILSLFIFKDREFRKNLFENLLILAGIVIFCFGK